MRHAVLFASLALLAIAVSLALGERWRSVELLVIAAAVVLLGVPHGALDVIHAARRLTVKGPARWAAFVAAYVAVAALVVAGWVAAPTLALSLFLLISALHFSGDLEEGAPRHLRALHGAALVTLPAWFHREDLTELFAHLVPGSGASQLVAALSTLAPAVLVLLAAVLAAGAVGRLRSAASAPPPGALLESTATLALTLAAPPLTAFAVYFCALHSARHVARTGRVFALPGRDLLRAAALPTLATALAVPIGLAALPDTPPDARTLQVVFIGLAALTVPHMMLIEPLRLRGWRA